MSRWSGLSDVSLKRWIEDGFTPLRSKIVELCENTGVSLQWLLHGHGNAKTELAKVKQGPSGGKASTVQEALTTIPEVVKYITDHGDDEDVKMVEDFLTAAQRRILERKAGPSRGPRRVKY
jgi:hypothetical protein